MEGDELLIPIKGVELPFHLRNGATAIPVGPEYIKHKQLKVGNKYAMNFLQSANTAACIEPYTYESKALDNDLFEALPNIIAYSKQAPLISSAIQLEEKAMPVISTDNTPIEEEDFGDIDITTASNEQLYLLAKKRIEANLQSPITTGTDLNIDSLRIVKRKELRDKYKTQLEQADKMPITKPISSAQKKQQQRQQDRQVAKATRIAKQQAIKKAAINAAFFIRFYPRKGYR